MLNFIEKVGNIKVYTEHFADDFIEVQLYNGSDCISSETYFDAIEKNAIADLLSKVLDIYTEEFLLINCITGNMVKITDNTYRIGEKDYFCKIDNTRYFKHFHKLANEFVADKNGKKIIDR